MEPIQLKMKPKIWLYVFIIFYAYTSILVVSVEKGYSMSLLLLVTLAASVIVTGVIVGIFYFLQKEVILNDKEIKRIGISSTSIAYNDIKIIKVGWGSFSIFDERKDPINITILQSNFRIAKEYLNKKIKDRTDIQIKGSKLFIDKFITGKSSYT